MSVTRATSDTPIVPGVCESRYAADFAALGAGHRHRPITIAGVRFRDGQWLYADADGIIVSDVEPALKP
jgi:regulator of RNase E activity RraA